MAEWLEIEVGADVTGTGMASRHLIVPRFLEGLRRVTSSFMTRSLLLFVCLCAFVSPGQAAATQNGEATAASMIAFEIDAQPVASALELYSAVTGIQVVYDGALVFGRLSNPVRRSMSPSQALKLLLDGTGLSAVYGAPNVFTLVAKSSQQSGKQLSIDDYMPYLGIVQGTIEDAFCRQAFIAPGSYHAKLQFWIDPRGRVLSPQLLDSESDTAREHSIVTTLQGLVIDRAPPSGMPQPVVMEISRRSPRETGDCGGWRGQGATMQKAASP